MGGVMNTAQFPPRSCASASACSARRNISPPPRSTTCISVTPIPTVKVSDPLWSVLAAAQRGPNGPLIQDYEGPQAGRLELRLQGSSLLRRGARDAVKFSLAGHAGNTHALWAVGATLVMDRQTRAVLSLDVASEVRRG